MKIIHSDQGMTRLFKRRKVTGIITMAILALLAGGSLTITHSAAVIEEVADFGSNPGNLRMFKYLPDGVGNPAPLVIALHGCRQSGPNFGDEAGWTTLADRWGFALLLPHQKGSPFIQPQNRLPSASPLWTFSYLDINNFLGCFNWFEPGDTERGQGEALSIKQMIDKMQTDHSIDPGRVFITGLSAGGAMTAVMLAAYPEVFAGGAIVGGVPYGCAENSSEAGSCMKPGKDAKPAEWGERVRKASPHTGPWPRISMWHGSEDDSVDPMNARELMEQWTNVQGIDQTPDAEDSVQGYPRKAYKDNEGKILVESFTITGMAHGKPVDPGFGEEQCGASGPFMLDVDICSSLYIGRFWGLDKATDPRR